MKIAQLCIALGWVIFIYLPTLLNAINKTNPPRKRLTTTNMPTGLTTLKQRHQNSVLYFHYCRQKILLQSGLYSANIGLK